MMSKNLKIAWVLEAATPNYIIGCIRFAQRMKHLKSKYPTIILVPDTFTDEEMQPLIESGFDYYVFKHAQTFLERSLYTSALIEPLRITDYDLLYNFEGDMLPTINIDHIVDLNIINLSTNMVSYIGSTGIMIFKPSIDAYNKIKEAFLAKGNTAVLESFLITDRFSGSEYTKYITYNYSIQINFNTEIMHFPGSCKPWTDIFNEFKFIYLNASEEEFNKYVDKYLTVLIFYSELAELLHMLDWKKEQPNFKDIMNYGLNKMLDLFNT